ncbi:hypothetical protein FOZ60_014918 [Perkinsus olseni]|uniref:Uncharacterized protein n=1 Tax=Perkinsus olseni TaxID=32597 RepID=A0A7J6P6L4_PEROL|nr:hypothetical protein FOZ60_014918 [Perkinsus olseni]
MSPSSSPSDSGLSSESSAAQTDAFGWPVWQGTRSFKEHGKCSVVVYDTGRTEAGEVIPLGDDGAASDLQKFRVGLTVKGTNKKAWLELPYDDFDQLFTDEDELAGEATDSKGRFDWLVRRLSLTVDAVDDLVLTISNEPSPSVETCSDDDSGDGEDSKVEQKESKSRLRIEQLEKQARRTKLEAKRRAKIAEIEKIRCEREAEAAAKVRAEAARYTEETQRRMIELKRERDIRVAAAKEEEIRRKFEAMKLDKIRQDNIKRREIRSVMDLM